MDHSSVIVAKPARFHWLAMTLGELTVVNIGFYAAMSLLSLHLVEVLALNAMQTGAVLLASSLGLRISRFFLAPLIDRIPIRRSLMLFTGIGTLGYLGLYGATGFLAVMFCVFLIGTGYGLNGLLVTTLSSFAPDKYRKQIYPLQYTLANVAAAAGPFLVHGFIRPVDPFLPFLFAGGMFLAGGVIAWRIDRSQLPDLVTPHGFYHHLKQLIRRGAIWRMLAVVTMGWILYSQKFAILPLFISDVLQAPKMVGLMMLVFSMVIIVTALPVAGLAGKKASRERILVPLSFVLYALAYGALYFWPNREMLFASVTVCALAEGMVMPSFNNLIRDLTEPAERLAGFALAAVAIATGEFLGMAGGVEGYRALASGGAATLGFLWLAILGLVFAAAYTFFLTPTMKEG